MSFRVSGAALLLALLLHYVPASDVLAALRELQLIWLVPAAVIIFTWRLFAAQRLAVFARVLEMNSGALRLFGVSLVSSFFATVTPGYALNGVVRWYLLSESGRFKTAALAALFADRIFDLLMMIGLGLLGLAISRIPVVGGLQAVALLLFALLAACWYVALTPAWSRIAASLAPRAPLRLQTAILRSVDAMTRFRAMARGDKLRVGVLSLVCNLTNALGMFCLFRALDLPLGYADALWLRGAVFVAALLPITVLGIGVREALLAGLLLPAGVAPAVAIGLGALMLGRDLVAALAGGVVLVFWRGTVLPRALPGAVG